MGWAVCITFQGEAPLAVAWLRMAGTADGASAPSATAGAIEADPAFRRLAPAEVL